MDIREVFYALSDEIRLKIVRLLISHQELCVCQFQEIFNLPQPHISFHLRILKKAGLVNSRKEGKWNYYSLNKENPLLKNLVPIIEKNIRIILPLPIYYLHHFDFNLTLIYEQLFKGELIWLNYTHL